MYTYMHICIKYILYLSYIYIIYIYTYNIYIYVYICTYIYIYIQGNHEIENTFFYLKRFDISLLRLRLK